ncbi:MAG: hypothetical protein AAFP86_01125, partial [Planctomycetota bacterium]
MYWRWRFPATVWRPAEEYPSLRDRERLSRERFAGVSDQGGLVKLERAEEYLSSSFDSLGSFSPHRVDGQRIGVYEKGPGGLESPTLWIDSVPPRGDPITYVVKRRGRIAVSWDAHVDARGDGFRIDTVALFERVRDRNIFVQSHEVPPGALEVAFERIGSGQSFSCVGRATNGARLVLGVAHFEGPTKDGETVNVR